MSETHEPKPPIRDRLKDIKENFMKKIKKGVPFRSSLTPETEQNEQKLEKWLKGQGGAFWRECYMENPEQIGVIADALNRLSESMMSAAGNLGEKDMLEAARIISTVTAGFKTARETFKKLGGQENASPQQP